MQLPDLKQLEKILKLCRKQGVTDLTMGEFSFKFGDLPNDSLSKEEPEETMPDGAALPPGITLDQMIHWSSQPDPLAERQEQ